MFNFLKKRINQQSENKPKQPAEERKTGPLPKSMNDREAWAIRSLPGKHLKQAAELKPEYRHFGEPMFYRIDYQIDRCMSYGNVLKVIRALADYPGGGGIQLFTGGVGGSNLTGVSTVEELDNPYENASVAVAGQFELGMAPMFVMLFNQTDLIRVRIHQGMNLPVAPDKVDGFLEKVLDEVFMD